MNSKQLIEAIAAGDEASKVVNEVTTTAGKVTVAVFAGPVLSSALTQYDQRQSKTKYYNPYALGQYFAAANQLKDELKAKKMLDLDTPEAFESLKGLLGYYFSDTFSPIRKVIKQIDQYLQTGKAPNIAKLYKKESIDEQGKWIQQAIKQPGALRKELGAKTTTGPRGGEIEEPIPAKKLSTTISKLQKKGEGDKTLTPKERLTLQRALLARKLRSFGGKGESIDEMLDRVVAGDDTLTVIGENY